MIFGRKKKEETTYTGQYIVVFHNWFVDSKGFDILEFDNMTRDDVNLQALLHKSKIEETFNHMAYKIIEVRRNV